MHPKKKETDLRTRGNGTGYFEHHFFEGQSNESYEFIDETNPMKPKLIRKDFGSVETGPLSL